MISLINRSTTADCHEASSCNSTFREVWFYLYAPKSNVTTDEKTIVESRGVENHNQYSKYEPQKFSNNKQKYINNFIYGGRQKIKQEFVSKSLKCGTPLPPFQSWRGVTLNFEF